VCCCCSVLWPQISNKYLLTYLLTYYVSMNMHGVVTRLMMEQQQRALERAMTRVRQRQSDVISPAWTKWIMTTRLLGPRPGWPAEPEVPATVWTRLRGPDRRRSWRWTRPDAVRRGSERRCIRRRRHTADSPRRRTSSARLLWDPLMSTRSVCSLNTSRRGIRFN